jgi:Pyruvate/2-oxoacid:ferredoxin oxidoreductase delta subunit
VINLNTAGNRFVRKKKGIIGPVPPHPIEYRKTSREDYPDIPQEILDVADMWVKMSFGQTDLSDEYIAVIQHLFTVEEARIARHLRGARGGRTASELAEMADCPVQEAVRIMDILVDDKRIFLGGKPGENRKYAMQPLLPGAWETILIQTSMFFLNDWHKKFIDLFVKLYNTGFTTVNVGKRPPGIRYLPVGQSIEMNPMALPSDKLGIIFDQYKDFATGLCQCRMGTEVSGNGCGRPKDTCITMGPLALREIREGRQRRLTMKEALEIKVEAEANGLVSWTMGMEVGGSNTSCSCCGDCCMMMRSISQFDSPGYIAPPHFMPEVDEKKCSYCAKCARSCPMGAWTVNAKAKTRSFNSTRCVGCGLCFVACDKKKAIKLKPVLGYVDPVILKVEKASHPLASISGKERS